jgi:DNA (cytosine-5)-methyltransferase 1
MKKRVRKLPIKALDLFSGVGGSSYGARLAGVRVVAAIETWELAVKAYEDNFSDVHVYAKKCEDVSPAEVKRRFGPIRLLIASPECTSHTCAKGAGKRSEKSRETAFQVLRFAKVLKPRWIIIENVINMRRWRRYRRWLLALKELGYKCREQVLNAADFSVPQSRKRLFILLDRRRVPPEVRPPRTAKHVAVREIIESNGRYPYTPLNSENRAEATRNRARIAMRTLGRRARFLLVYYGSDGAGGWQRLNVPLRTITTLDRFGHVRPAKRGYEMRMLQVPELQRAMGLPVSTFRLKHGTRRDRIRLLGNAVCPPVMRAIVRTITKPTKKPAKTVRA